MPRKSILRRIQQINGIADTIRADIQNLGEKAAFRVLSSEKQIKDFCRSVKGLRKTADDMKRLQKASTRLAANR